MVSRDGRIAKKVSYRKVHNHLIKNHSPLTTHHSQLAIIALKIFTFGKLTIMSFNITEILNRLHINDINEAFSTGNTWGSSPNAATKDILSPVDGQKIASV